MKSNMITIKNEIPELLQAVCEHPRCPEWLRFDIWDSFSNQNQAVSYKANHWRTVLEAVESNTDDRQPGMCQYPDCDQEMDVLRHCLSHAQAILSRKVDAEWPEDVQ